MKHFRHLFTVLLLLCSTVAFAAEKAVIDGITYELITKGKQAKVVAGDAEYTGDIVIPESVEYNGVTYNVTIIGDNAFSYCSVLTSIEIPNSVTSIGEYAFSYCSGLTSIEIPNSVTSIGHQAFYGCSGLKNVVIGNSVTGIGAYAFRNCTGLTSVTIGSGVGYISKQAFAKCDNLADVYCLATSVPSTDATAFNESYPEYMTLHVPAEAINSYKTTAPWSSFGTIKAIEDVEVPVCAAPVVSYNNGQLAIECETEGAEFVTKITSNDINSFYSNIIDLSATYNISVYATVAGYENSETVNATLCWIECECNGSDDTGVINIPATAALITSAGGAVTVSCKLNGEAVAVYTADGVLVGTATIDNGTATIATGLSKGTIAIVKIGEKSVKVVM